MRDQKAKQQGVKRRDFIKMTAGAALVLFLPGCRRTILTPSSLPAPTGWIDTQCYKKAPPWRIGRSARGDLSPWLVMLSAHIEYGIKEKYKGRFREYFSIPANWDPNKQIQDIQKLLAKDIDLLLIDPLDHAVVAAGLREAMDKGIPVILLSSTVQNAPYVSLVTTNEEERGTICADWLCRVVPNGNVAILVSEPAAGDKKAWQRGVHHYLDAQPHIRRVKETTCFWSSTAAKEAMSAVLNQFSAIDGVLVNNGVVAQGVAQAFVEVGRAIPPIAGADDWNGWLRMAKEHGVRFIGLTGGANLGLRCVDLATEVLTGNPVPAYVEFPYEMFDESAIDRYYHPDLSDHYWAVHDLPDTWIEKMFKP
nr:substrate-binding domain-containing protein [Chloroflexota bacterium]